MKWRCEWCGKPHAENDPPCDNCGHSEFEKAVVPAAPEGDEATADAYGHVWVCTECGNDHPKNTPPCDRCGHDKFERREFEYDEDEVMDEMLGRSESNGPSTDIGYLDVLDARLGLLAVGVVALVAALALGYLGVVDLPGIDIGEPAPIDAPGNATEYGGLSFDGVEAAYLTALNDRRTDQGYESLTRDEKLDRLAGRLNRALVASEFEGGDAPGPRDVLENSGVSCSVSLDPLIVTSNGLQNGTFASYETEDAAARALIERRSAARSFQSPGANASRAGVDVHVAPNGDVYVLVVGC